MPYREPVLIVDDDPIFRAVAVSVMKSRGIRTVLMAEDGQAAIEALDNANLPIGLIILDLKMPKLDGFAFLRSISNYSGDIILASGEPEKIIRSAESLGRKLGINIFGALQKPINIDEISVMLNRRLASRSDQSRIDPGPGGEDSSLPGYQLNLA